MHLTNLQLVLVLFVISNVLFYLLGRRHGRAVEPVVEPAKLAIGTVRIRRGR